MKKSIITCVCLFALVLFCGCPDKTSYPLEVKEKGSTDIKMLGTWTTDDFSEVKKVKISMDADKTYKVEVLEEGDDYSAETTIFKGWLTKMSKRKFLVLQEMSDDMGSENYYVYDIMLGDNTFTSHDILSKETGTDAIVSVKSYQEKVKASIGKVDFLSSEITWKKAE